MTVVNAHWAYWSKESGDQRDYRVLRCSTGSPDQFTAAVHAENPGTPRTEDSGQPDSLPWVVFGTRDDGDDAYCTLAVMEWTDRTDWTNRRITATTWATVPYRELSSRAAEHADLYAALRGAALGDGSMAELALPSRTAEPVAEAPTPRMLYWAAGVAALLLEGRVVVTGAGRLDVGERIAAIDAVLRMLPYGYRADLSACTWTPVPEQAAQRLCFGDYAGGNLIRAPWDEALPRPNGEVAARYLELLTHHLDKGEADRVLLWLRQNARWRPFDEPHRALEVLDALSLAENVLAEVREGRGTPDRVMKALGQKGVDAFSPDERADLFAYMFSLRDPGLYAGMAQYACPELYEATLPALHAALVPARSGPASAAADAEVAAIVQTFVPPVWEWKDADSVVARLLTVPGDRHVPYALVDMWLARFAAAPAREWPAVAGALLAAPHVGLAAVARCREARPNSLNRLLALLHHGGPVPWTTVLRWAVDVFDTGSAAAGTLAKAMQQCPGVAVEAFRFAAGYRTFDSLDRPLWQEWLRIAADSRSPAYSELGSEVAEFGPRRTGADTPRGAARMGLLRYRYGQSFAHPKAADVEEYVSELADACRMLPHADAWQGGPAVEMLRVTIGARRTQPQGAELTVAVLLAALDHADALGADALGRLLGEAVDPSGRLRPAVRRELAADQAAWDRIMAAAPDVAIADRMGQLEDSARQDRTAAELAGHWAWLLVHGAAAPGGDKQLERALHEWPGRRRPEGVHELLTSIRAILIHSHRRTARDVDTWVVGTARLIADEEWLGRQAAEDLRKAVRQRRGSQRVEDVVLARALKVSQAAPAPARPADVPARPAGAPPRPSGAPPYAGSSAAQYAADVPPRPMTEPGDRPSFAARPRSGRFRPSSDMPGDPWYLRRRPLMYATGGAGVALLLALLFVFGVFDDGGGGGKTPVQPSPPAPSAPQAPASTPAAEPGTPTPSASRTPTSTTPSGTGGPATPNGTPVSGSPVQGTTVPATGEATAAGATGTAGAATGAAQGQPQGQGAGAPGSGRADAAVLGAGGASGGASVERASVTSTHAGSAAGTAVPVDAESALEPVDGPPLHAAVLPMIWYALMATLIGGLAAYYRCPRWSGQLTVRIRNDAGPGYQVAGILVPDRLGRAFVEGRADQLGVLQLPNTTARVWVAARRDWLHPRRIDLLVRARLSDSGRRDSVRCPAGGRRMILGLDVRHNPEPAPPPTPPPPNIPAQPPAPHPSADTGPYAYPPPPSHDAHTRVVTFPNDHPQDPTDETRTVELPPQQFSPGPRARRPTDPHTPDPYISGEFYGGPETGGSGRWPND